MVLDDVDVTELWKTGSLGMVDFMSKNGFLYNPDFTVLIYRIIYNKDFDLSIFHIFMP